MDAPAVIVETHLAGGLPAFTLVGLPETAVREARDRVRGALANCGFDFPDGRVVVNLAPADLLKEGGRFDLAIAISILRATGQLREPDQTDDEWEFLGELSLTGELRPIRGGLCAALALAPQRKLILPMANRADSHLADGRLVPLAHLRDVIRWLQHPEQRSQLLSPPLSPSADSAPSERSNSHEPVVGQQQAKRALALAAAGGHHLLMIGPPGTGKSLLARSFAQLLPDLDAQSEMELAAIYSVAGLTRSGRTPPFRDPHQSVSTAAMVGGGRAPGPGEISLAHGGVLFLDELPHFKPSVLDSLREPLESGRITVVRANWQAEFPARFQLLTAMNPCPAGMVCNDQDCRCRPDQVARYQARVSGPLLDRIDLHVPVPEVPVDALLDPDPALLAQPFDRADITSARELQIQRQGGLNAQLRGEHLKQICSLGKPERQLLSRAAKHYQLSARGFHRVMKVARTIADLEHSSTIGSQHLAEALSYRSISWGSDARSQPLSTDAMTGV